MTETNSPTQLDRIETELQTQGELLAQISGLLNRAAPLLESRAARLALGGGGSVLDALRKGGKPRG